MRGKVGVKKPPKRVFWGFLLVGIINRMKFLEFFRIYYRNFS